MAAPVALSREGALATVTVDHDPGNCVQDTVIRSAWPDGTAAF